MERFCLDRDAIKIQLPKQLLKHGTPVILAYGVAGLSDGHAQGCRVERHLSDERRTAADDGLDRASESFAIKDQLIKIVCTTWDLSDHPVTDGGADGSDIHLQKEVAEGGIRGWALELDRKRLSEHIVMTPGKTLQIAGALEFS